MVVVVIAAAARSVLGALGAAVMSSVVLLVVSLDGGHASAAAACRAVSMALGPTLALGGSDGLPGCGIADLAGALAALALTMVMLLVADSGGLDLLSVERGQHVDMGKGVGRSEGRRSARGQGMADALRLGLGAGRLLILGDLRQDGGFGTATGLFVAVRRVGALGLDDGLGRGVNGHGSGAVGGGDSRGVTVSGAASGRGDRIRVSVVQTARDRRDVAVVRLLGGLGRQGRVVLDDGRARGRGAAAASGGRLLLLGAGFGGSVGLARLLLGRGGAGLVRLGGCGSLRGPGPGGGRSGTREAQLLFDLAEADLVYGLSVSDILDMRRRRSTGAYFGGLGVLETLRLCHLGPVGVQLPVDELDDVQHKVGFGKGRLGDRLAVGHVVGVVGFDWGRHLG